MSLLKTNEIQVFNGTTVTITATTAEVSADLNVGADLDVTGALTLGTALAVAEGGTGATDAATARTNLDVDQAGTDNSTDVSLVTTSHDYLSIAGQAITLGPIDLATDVTGNLPYASISGTPTLGTAAAEDVGYFATAAQGALADSAVQPGDDANTLGSGSATDGYVLTADGAGGTAWEAASGGGASLPAGAILSFAMASPPSGWLVCDGSALSRTTYASLFTAIGTTWGVGDGSTTFNLPNLNGAFLRGTGAQTFSGTSYDGGSIGDVNGDLFQNHWHIVNDGGQNRSALATANGFNAGLANRPHGTNTGSGGGGVADGYFAARTITAASYTGGSARNGTETRPFNATVQYCIKY